jgi:hypothetical protein
MRPTSRQQLLARIFTVPALLAMLIAVGLTSGVLGDGIWDVISWITLAVPIAVIVFNVFC